MKYRDAGVDIEKAKPTCQISKVLQVLKALGVNMEVRGS